MLSVAAPATAQTSNKKCTKNVETHSEMFVEFPTKRLWSMSSQIYNSFSPFEPATNFLNLSKSLMPVESSSLGDVLYELI